MKKRGSNRPQAWLVTFDYPDEQYNMTVKGRYLFLTKSEAFKWIKEKEHKNTCVEPLFHKTTKK